MYRYIYTCTHARLHAYTYMFVFLYIDTYICRSSCICSSLLFTCMYTYERMYILKVFSVHNVHSVRNVRDVHKYIHTHTHTQCMCVCMHWHPMYGLRNRPRLSRVSDFLDVEASKMSLGVVYYPPLIPPKTDFLSIYTGIAMKIKKHDWKPRPDSGRPPTKQGVTRTPFLIPINSWPKRRVYLCIHPCIHASRHVLM